MKNKLQHGLLAAALLVAGATTAQAQVTFGPRVGLNLATVNHNLKENDSDFKPKYILGPQVGLSLNAQFGNLSIQPSLLFSQKGYKTEESETFGGTTFKSENSLRLSYLEIPINFVYTTGETEGFQVFAGPYIGVGIGGKYKYKVSGGGINEEGDGNVKFAGKYGDDEDVQYVRGLDFGLNGGIGYKAGPIQLQAGYGLGLSNLIPNDEDDKAPEDKIKNGVIHLSVSYFFGE